jgi:hypothetical protein
MSSVEWAGRRSEGEGMMVLIRRWEKLSKDRQINDLANIGE